MLAAEKAGKVGPELQAVEDAWNAQAGLKLFHEAVADTINAGVHVNKQGLIEEFNKQAKDKSLSEMKRAFRNRPRVFLTMSFCSRASSNVGLAM